jgi:LysM repeat protein
MSKPAPRRKKRKRQKRPSGHRSPWVYLAPAALLGAVTVIVLILSSAGVIGHPSDGTVPLSTTPAGTVQTLPVPDTPPPPEPPPPEPPPLPPPPPPGATTAKTTTTSTNATTTTASTTPSTTATTSSTTTTETSNDGQHVKWTVKPGDTLFSIATQFGTSVKALLRLNPSIDPSALQVGQTLVVR